jgi:pimeloyl-ACP methyl ester carboxylesterase
MIKASKSASEQRLASMKVPGLVIMGSKDPDFKSPEAEAQWVAKSLNSTYKMLPGAGHYPHAEMPELTAPLVIDFIRSLEQRKETRYAG